MFMLTQLNINQRQRLWVLMDTHTCQPLLYPLWLCVHQPRNLLPFKRSNFSMNSGTRNMA